MAQAGTEGKVPMGSKDGQQTERGFAQSKLHAGMARFATSRWSKLVGYGILIFACRVVRGMIRA